MSFLDDLQRQAAALKAQPNNDSAALARNTSLTEVACKTALTIEVGSKRLDDLARWLAGHPHAFLNDALSLRRTEA